MDVFINCPFDAAYGPQFRAIVFTLKRLGFSPRCALEEGNANSRIAKILELIRVCRLGVHDISMQTLDAATGLPRLNMAFELGLFLGCRHFGAAEEHSGKEFLVLDSDPHRFHRSLSDFSGYDVACHGSRPELTIGIVRDWLANALRQRVYGSVPIRAEFGEFERDLPILAAELTTDPDRIAFVDLCDLIDRWIRKSDAASAPTR